MEKDENEVEIRQPNAGISQKQRKIYYMIGFTAFVAICSTLALMTVDDFSSQNENNYARELLQSFTQSPALQLSATLSSEDWRDSNGDPTTAIIYAVPTHDSFQANAMDIFVQYTIDGVEHNVTINENRGWIQTSDNSSNYCLSNSNTNIPALSQLGTSLFRGKVIESVVDNEGYHNHKCEDSSSIMIETKWMEDYYTYCVAKSLLVGDPIMKSVAKANVSATLSYLKEADVASIRKKINDSVDQDFMETCPILDFDSSRYVNKGF